MKLNNNMFAVLSGDDDGGMADLDQGKNNRKKGQQNNNQKKGGKVEVIQGKSKQSDELTDEQKKARAEKLFKQKNELSEEEKKLRNKQKKLKKIERKNNDPRSPTSAKSTTAVAAVATTPTAAGATPAGGKPTTPAAPVVPAAPLKTAEEKRKEEQERKDKKVRDYLDAVESALPGFAFLFKLDLNQIPTEKDKVQTISQLREKPYKTIEQLIATKFFLDKFKSTMPETLRGAIPQGMGQAKDELVPLGRYEMKSVFIPDLPLHLAALLSGPTDNGEPKTPAETLTLVEELLEGLFDVRPPKRRFENRPEDEDDVDEYVGSAGNVKKDTVLLSDFITNAPSKNQLKKQKRKQQQQGQQETGTQQGQETGPQDKGKEPEVQSTPQAEAGSSSGSTTAASETTAKADEPQEQAPPQPQVRKTAAKKEIFDPTTYLTEEVNAVFPDSKLGTLARRVPKGWKVAQVRTPIFSATGGRPERTNAFGGGSGGGGRGRGFGRPTEASKTAAPVAPVATTTSTEGKSGFMYSGKGLDQCYVLWKDSNMVWLFTTGKLPKPVPQEAATPAPAESQQQSVGGNLSGAVPSKAGGSGGKGSAPASQAKGGAEGSTGGQAKAPAGGAQSKGLVTGGAGGKGGAPAGQAKGKGATAPKAEAKPKTGK